MENLLNFKDGDKVLVAGELAEEITQALYTIYKKEVEPNTGIVLESQIFQTLQQVNDFLELNKSNLKKDSVGVLYGVSDINAAVNDLSAVSQAVSSMTDEQVDNSAVIIKPAEVEEGVDIEKPLSQISLENLCKNLGLPVYNSVKSYMDARGNKTNAN